MRRRVVQFICMLLLICVAGSTAACGSSGGGTWQEQYDLGMKYMTDGNYSRAIEAFSKAISIDAKKEEAIEQIVYAYQQTGNAEKAFDYLLDLMEIRGEDPESVDQTVEIIMGIGNREERLAKAQMAFAATGDPDFAKIIIYEKGKDGDYEAIDRMVNDMNYMGGVKDESFETLIQYYVNEKDMDGLKELSAYMTEREICPGSVLTIDAWTTYGEEGEDGVIRYLESFYEEEREMPQVGYGQEFYVGEYDAEGKRSGYGICYYGEGVKNDSRIYAGFWANDLRNGKGRAYEDAGHRIEANWADDYPQGEAKTLVFGIYSVGQLDGGHVVAPTDWYDEGMNHTGVHCIPDDTKSSGYAVLNDGAERAGTCNHMKNHGSCWDCKVQEGE